jgi:MOSC domain-containing protein YiiM
MNKAQQIRIHHIFTSPAHNYFTRKKFDVGENEDISHTSIELQVGKGLQGDRFEHSKYPITLFSLEVAQEVCSLLELELDVKLFRRNIIVSGVKDLNELIGKEFHIGNTAFEGVAHCPPCPWMNAVMKKGAYALMRGRGGLRVRVIKSGTLTLGTHLLQTQ